VIVFCNGLAKSGSSFLFQITEKLAEAAGFNQDALRKQFVPDQFVPYKPHPHFVSVPPDKLSQWVRDIPDSQLIVVKTHDPCCPEAAELLRQKKIKVINSYRDPRDAAVSLWDSGLKERLTVDEKYRRFNIPSFPSAIMILAHLANTNAEWIRNEDTLNLDFEEIAGAPYDVAIAIEQYLQLGTNSFSIVSHYLKNRGNIREYNIGVSGRYKTYMSLFEEGWCNQLYKQYDKLIEKMQATTSN